MEKQRRQELKRKYKEEQAELDPVLHYFSKLKQLSLLKAPLTKEQLEQWNDEELEQNIIIFAEAGIASAGKSSNNQNLLEWERVALQKLPLGIQAVFATYLFEGSLFLNGSYFDFFLQNNGTFALEALNGYKLMGNRKMVDILEQCIGAYLVLQKQGVIDELYGVPHTWDIEESIFIEINQRVFDKLDEEYQLMRDSLRSKLEIAKVRFIRKHPDLFLAEE